MSTYRTYADLLQEVEDDENLEGENFIESTELLALFNRGIAKCERHIHTIYEDYYLDYTNLNLVEDESEIALPTDIYASKIRRLLYENANDRYEIKRLRTTKAFIDKSFTDYESNSTENYKYLLVNKSSSDGTKIVLSPASRETASDRLKCWYLRHAERLDGTTTQLVDIPPECYDYLVQFVKTEAIKKEIGNPKLMEAKQNLKELEYDMITMLKNRIPDDDDFIEQDLTHYEDSV